MFIRSKAVPRWWVHSPLRPSARKSRRRLRALRWTQSGGVSRNCIRSSHALTRSLARSRTQSRKRRKDECGPSRETRLTIVQAHFGSKDRREGRRRILMETHTGIKTLIVEDSMPTRRMLRARLETLGCTIVGEAENPTQGLKLFRELDPQIVTLD